MINLPNTEIAVNSWDDVNKIVPVLLNNDYAIMITLENDLFIISYEYTPMVDRNDMIFRTCSGYEYDQMKEMEKENAENA